MADTFILLPLSMETKELGDKKVSQLSSSDPALGPLMQQINALTQGFKQSGFALEVPPPPPQSINPNRSKHDAFKANNWGESLKQYSLALDMAASRPPWEPAALASDEMSVLLCNRSAAFLGAGLYAEAYADATACIE
jgi:translocation protein SEC72